MPRACTICRDAAQLEAELRESRQRRGRQRGS